MAVLYCVISASVFVGGLYVLVPSQVRQLNRDNPKQIQWRTFSSSVVCVLMVATYPYLFCNLDQDDEPSSSSLSLSVLERIGWIIPSFSVLIGALLHTVVLYCGPITGILLQVYTLQRQDILSYFQALYEYTVLPKLYYLIRPRSESEQWQIIRNFIVAPLFEEIIFRGCIIAVLLSCPSMTPMRITFLSPLFFGMAHCHHAVLKLQSGEKPLVVVLVTLIQFTYTSLFGSYTAHAFLRSGSILAIFLSHSFCNGMGLPSLFFLQPNSLLYPYRFILLLAHIVGIMGFIWGFSSSWFLPRPGVFL